MASTSAAATKRSRATAEQIRGMVDLLGETPGLGSGRFQRMHGKLENQKKWKEMAEKLNAIGGAVKSVEQWVTVWRDLKSRTSNRVRDRNNQQSQTGNRSISVAPLTETEMRIVELIGDSYIEGAPDCLDSLAVEEHLNLIVEEEYLEDGASIELQAISEVRDPPATPSAVDRRRYESVTPAITPRTPAATPRRGLKRKNADVAESEAEKRFLAIAEKQADTMRMMAETQKKLAENDERRIEATFAMAEAINNIARSNDNIARSTENQSKATTFFGEAVRICSEIFSRLSGAILENN